MIGTAVDALPPDSVGSGLWGWPARDARGPSCGVRGARSARWSDIDFETRLWTIPAGRAKNGNPNPVPLSAGAVRILKAITHDSEYLFPLGSGYLPHDPDAVEAVRALSGVADVGLHDVRRTVATRLAALGVLPDVIELILGHTLPKLQRTYQTHSFEREKRAALEAWSAELDAILRGTIRARAEVLVIRRAQGYFLRWRNRFSTASSSPGKSRSTIVRK